MQATAAKVGYSETVFAAPLESSFRVRYFAPLLEVPFCGHATIALGVALAKKFGSGTFHLTLNDTTISVDGVSTPFSMSAELQSPPTSSVPVEPAVVETALRIFGYAPDDLDSRIPVAMATAGAHFLVLALKSRERLHRMNYEIEAGRDFMTAIGVTTILWAFAETPQLFHTRNAFAAGGVYEDPATGAATAAFAGYLRDIGWPHGGDIDIVQGEDMGCPSRLHAKIDIQPGSSIKVSGTARIMSGDREPIGRTLSHVLSRTSPHHPI